MSAETFERRTDEPSGILIALFAFATGALVANLYYAQPLIASIGAEMGMKPDFAGSVVSVTQIGYGTGLFFLVSLADLVENKRLVLTLISLAVLGLVGVASSTSALPFFAAYFLVGLCSCAAQILVPFIAHLAPEGRRGRIVGNVMAGLLTGIMLARPVALFIAAHFGWRAVFWFSAATTALIGVTLFRLMPAHEPRAGKQYLSILRSMLRLLRDTPVVRQRAVYQSLLFAAFNLFWTAAPIMLAERFGMSEQAIALFALAAAGGALAAPIAGRLADRGITRIMTVVAMLTVGLTCYATSWAVSIHSLIALVVLTILLDAAVQINQITSQRMIFSVSPEMRGRVNGIYMTVNFIGGAIGSILGTITYHSGGWPATAAMGGVIAIIALSIFFFDDRQARIETIRAIAGFPAKFKRRGH